MVSATSLRSPRLPYGLMKSHYIERTIYIFYDRICLSLDAFIGSAGDFMVGWLFYYPSGRNGCSMNRYLYRSTDYFITLQGGMVGWWFYYPLGRMGFYRASSTAVPSKPPLNMFLRRRRPLVSVSESDFDSEQDDSRNHIITQLFVFLPEDYVFEDITVADGNFAAPNPGFAWPIQALNGSSNTRVVVRPFHAVLHFSAKYLKAPSSSSSSLACFGSVPAAIMQSLSSDLEDQRNKRLRKLVLEEQKRKQAVLLLECESKTKNLMLQKDEELALARNKTSELQNFTRVAEMETKAWEKKAIEKGTIAADLQTRLN
ncbi:hypothetical protein PHJA_002584000 [Phtheirospermum japonicum]|uniref:Uncharacterized protein n=1 Tax=Phtheirospermum japonicum TaxID=374723 RepID=A0A830CWY2_9LAMI|nr:hypothetical protein PHJA_002584000 [Phtheirospermum japonicum]